MKIRAKKRLKLKVMQPQFNEGDWVDDYYRGEEIPFSELHKYVGELVVIDYSTDAHPWYKVCRVHSVKDDSKNGTDDYVTFIDGSRRGGGLGKISRMFFDGKSISHPAYIWVLEKGGVESGTYKNNHQVTKRV